MPRLSSKTIKTRVGECNLVFRPNSRYLQCHFKVGKTWVRRSTGCTDQAAAAKRAEDIIDEYRFRQKHKLPVVSKRFNEVAKLAITEMDKKAAASGGKRTFKAHKSALENYLIPYFGNTLISSIDQDAVNTFDQWRVEKMGGDPSRSGIEKHNIALRCVFEEAVERGYMVRSRVPVIPNNGRKAKRRPAFNAEDYRALYKGMRKWVNEGRKGKSRDMRHLLRDYVLILANSGIRHGTEAYNLKWNQITPIWEDGELFLEFHVDGKTGPRDPICRENTVIYLKRIHERAEDLQHLTFDELLKQGVDKYVFRLPNGKRTKSLDQTFKACLKKLNLLKCPQIGDNRTLYSLRHTYATFSLLNQEIGIHLLAKQMGNSVAIIEKNYDHTQLRMSKSILRGKRYSLDDKEYRDRFDQILGTLEEGEGEVDTETVEALKSDDDTTSSNCDATGAAVTGLSAAQNTVDIAIGVNAAGSTSPNQDVATVLPNALSPQRSFEDEAFDAFERGDIDEDELLGLLSVGSATYTASTNLKTRALKARTSGALSKAGLMKIAA